MAKRVLASLSILAASSFLGTAAMAANTTPIRVRLLNCEPQWDKPDNAFQKGYSGEGYHNPAGSHYMRAHIAFYKDSDQSIDDALTNVSRIYLCKSKDNVMTCPTDSSNKLSDDYVLFDRSRSINKITAKRVVDWKGGNPTDRPDRGDALTSLNDLDWRDSANSQVVVVPRIQLVGAPLPGKSADDFFADASSHGACSNWSLMSKSPAGAQILIYSPTKVVPGTTARSLYDVCQMEGAKNWWGEGDGANQTVSAAVGEEVRLWMQQVQVAHEQRLQQSLPAIQYTWRNGKDPSTGAYRPSFIFLGPHIGSLGQSSRGGPQSNPQDFTFIDGSSLGDVRKAFADAKSLRSIAITVHEYHHRLQWAWDREVGYPDYCSYVSETMPSADVLNLCIPNFPGAANNSDHPLDGDCMNSGRLGLVNDEGPYGFKSRQKDPRYLLINDGSAALFWRYLYEQFSYPAGTTNAHPGGTDSTIQRPSTTTVLNSRFSDEGVDFVGWLYDGFTKVKDDPTTAFAAVDNVLREHLGRSFDDVLQDFHTALYLKDYTDSDDRWRFEWTHGKGASATTLLSAGKPFAVPNELYEFTCDSTGATCDGLLRTHRVLDSWKKGSPATRDLLDSTGSRVAAEPTYLGTYGTEAASVSPDSSWVGKTMRVRAWDRPGEHVRFRVFRIKSSGAKDLIPELQTTPAPFVDPTTMRETYEWQVAIDSNTKEVLLIASADVDGGSFEYEFGASLSTLAIVSPQESTPALIGHPSVGRRSFVIALLVKDSQGNVVYVPETKKSDLSIEIPGCSTTTNCKLSDSDYTIIPAVGGNLLLVVTVPASFYGSASSGTFDLKVTYANNATDTKVKALNYSNSSETLAATLLLDVSGSMGDFGGQKISALKKVAKGLIASLTPPDAGKPNPVVSMVTFTTDASTPFPLTEMTTSVRGQMEAAIDSLTPLYLTSIGDGLYEAQSGLAAKYDPSGNHLDREVVLLLTDGLNTTNSGPETYYATEPDPPNIPTGDGNGEWYKGKPLYFHQRVRDKLRVPTFTAVGIGQDADLTVLDKVTRLNKLNPLFVKGPEEDPTASPNRMTLDLADGMIAAFETALDYSRVSTARITGPVPPPIPIVYRVIGSMGVDGGEAANVTTAAVQTISSETSIPVESGAASLRVLVTSSHGGGAAGTLRSPSGQAWNATAVTNDGSSRSFNIPSPQAGAWSFASDATQGSEPDVIVAAAVSGSLKLFAFADAQFRTAKGEVLAGSPVVLRSVAVDGGKAATSCAFMEASVTAPGETYETVISLVDDGKHNDGLPGDGVFGGIYRTTGNRGIYDVVFRSICTSPITGSWVVREQRSGLVVQLRPEDDPDGDGIPTAVEAMCMKPYDPSDADEDFDGDGLTNRQEFLIGTNPCLSDSDGGGLADGSEIGESDPFDPTDDFMTAPLPELTPGNTKIHIKSGIVVGAGTLEIDTAPGISGPWIPVNDAWLPGQNFAIHSGLVNGTMYCYRLRYLAGTRASAWSYPLCATPNGDATPPTITVIANPQACGAAFAQPQFSFSDSPYPYDSWDTTIDLGLSSTGVSAMRIWEGAGPAPSTASWVAPQNAPVVKVPTTSSALSVQVRDGAGNLSRVATMPVSCTQAECFLKPNDIGCCAEAWSCGRARNYALLSESQLYVGDAVKVKNANGTSVPIANNGSGQTYIGVSAITGAVASVGSVDLRDRSRIEGSIECAGSVTFGNGIVVTGGTNQASTSLHLPKLSGFSVTFPSGGADVNLGVGQTATLSPGNYGSITVNASAELRLSTGTYYINNLTTEAQSRVKVTSTNGPVYLYIKSTLNYRGTVTDIAGRYDNLFWGFLGTAAVSVEAPLIGTIVAPAAPVSLKAISNGTHRGAVFAKQIDVQGQAAFVHYPFVGTWNAPLSQ